MIIIDFVDVVDKKRFVYLTVLLKLDVCNDVNVGVLADLIVWSHNN